MRPARTFFGLFVLILTIFVGYSVVTRQVNAVVQPSCDPSPVGLAAWWTADGNALDGRNRNNATLQNGAAFGTGESGQAFAFDGVDDYVEAPDSPSLNVSRLTVEAWVFPTSDVSGGGLDSTSMILTKESAKSNQYLIARKNNTACFSGGGIVTGNFAFFIEGLTGLPNDCSAFVDGGAQLPLNTWTHVALTYDGANVRAYVNGTLTRIIAVSGSIPPSGGTVQIGGRTRGNTSFWAGKIDEPAIYDRALSTNEIAAIVNAASIGKCRPTATAAPSGLVGWWGGDGDATDASGNGFNGTLQNGAAFSVNKVGQGFNFTANGTPHVQVPDNPLLRPANVTVEGWMKIESLPGDYITLIGKGWSDPGSFNDGYALGLAPDARPVFATAHNGSEQVLFGPTPITTFNTWHHYAATFDGFTKRLYVDGTLVASFVTESPLDYGPNPQNAPLTIGADWQFGGPFFRFNGYADEVTLFDRALSDVEIQSVFNAGFAGKLKQRFTSLQPPAVKTAAKGSSARSEPRRIDGITGPIVTVGDATITFGGGSGSGQTQEIPLPLGQLPLLPFPSVGLTYDISTSFAYAGSPTVCFNLPSFLTVQFPSLRILHLEGSVWVDRTASSNVYPILCSTPVPSLSPFAITLNAPTAADVSVSGRVTTAAGTPVRGAAVTMTRPDGSAKVAVTNSFGYYRFDSVAAGQSYLLGVSARRFRFTPRFVTVTDTLSDLDLAADQ